MALSGFVATTRYTLFLRSRCAYVCGDRGRLRSGVADSGYQRFADSIVQASTTAVTFRHSQMHQHFGVERGVSSNPS